MLLQVIARAPSLLVLAVLLWATELSVATYYMDDFNTSIIYNGSWLYSPSPNNPEIEGTYNSSYHTPAISTDPNGGGSMMIPFTGSGITIYCVQVPYNYADYMIISLDGSRPEIFDVPPPPPSNTPVVNVSYYDIQNLQFTTHILSINPPESNSFLFDYAKINDSEVGTPLIPAITISARD